MLVKGDLDAVVTALYNARFGGIRKGKGDLGLVGVKNYNVPQTSYVNRGPYHKYLHVN